MSLAHFLLYLFVLAFRNEKKRVESFKRLIEELPECNKLLLSWMIVHMTHVIERVSKFLPLEVISYGKCSKIYKTFLFLFSNKLLDIRAGIYKVLVRISNGEDSDQTTSSVCGDVSFTQQKHTYVKSGIYDLQNKQPTVVGLKHMFL